MSRRHGKGERLDASARVGLGALAGVVATAAMTAVMRRGWERLPSAERYSLPPTELMQVVSPEAASHRVGDRALAAHFAYGALCGGVLALARPRQGAVSAGLAGLAIWAGSYLGWIPTLGLLKPATKHPWRRNLLMLGTHLVWGLCFRSTLREMAAARSAFAARGAPVDRATG
jgi:hypothetical protein